MLILLANCSELNLHLFIFSDIQNIYFRYSKQNLYFYIQNTDTLISDF